MTTYKKIIILLTFIIISLGLTKTTVYAATENAKDFIVYCKSTEHLTIFLATTKEDKEWYELKDKTNELQTKLKNNEYIKLNANIYQAKGNLAGEHNITITKINKIESITEEQVQKEGYLYYNKAPGFEDAFRIVDLDCIIYKDAEGKCKIYRQDLKLWFSFTEDKTEKLKYIKTNSFIKATLTLEQVENIENRGFILNIIQLNNIINIKKEDIPNYILYAINAPKIQ